MQSQFADGDTELRTVPIGCIRKDNSHRDLLYNRLPHLFQCHRRLGLKLNPFQDACLLAAFQDPGTTPPADTAARRWEDSAFQVLTDRLTAAWLLSCLPI